MQMMLIRSYLVVSFFISFSLIASSRASAQPPVHSAADSSAILQQILETYGARGEELDPIWVRFGFTEYYCSEWLKTVDRMPNPPAEGRTKLMQGEIAKKGQLLHFSLEMTDSPTGSFISIFDGE